MQKVRERTKVRPLVRLAWGVIEGVEHARPALCGIMTFSLEFAYTTPLLYRRDLVDFITSHNKDGNNKDMANLEVHTPSGSDDKKERTLSISLGADYALPQFASWNNIGVWADISYIAKKKTR